MVEGRPGAVVLVTSAVVAALSGCSRPPAEPMTLKGNMLTVDNRSTEEWRGVEIWLNTYYRVTTDSIPPNGRFQTPLDNFVAGFGQRFVDGSMRVHELRLTARLATGAPVEIRRRY